MISEKFVKLYEKSFKENWDLPAYTDYGTKIHYTYAQLAEEIAKRHLLFDELGIGKGDKIAVLGRNSSEWGIAYLATVTYGAVVVPILPDFNPNDIQHIMNHSESRILFATKSIYETLDEEKMPALEAVFSLGTDRKVLYAKAGNAATDVVAKWDEKFAARYPNGFKPEDVKYPEIENTELASINYTSGTTGFSKGVMTPHNALAGNVTFGIRSGLLKRNQRILSFLPLSHAYGCAFDFLTATAVGTHVTFFGKVPAPKVLLQAFAEVKPHLIILVPLIMEKIYKNNILPKLSTYAMKLALNIPFLNTRIYQEIRDKLYESLGGNFSEVIVGGAAFSQEVSDFFTKIKFPYTVGYGMTECAPLISYEWWEDYKPGSAGKVLDIMEAKVVSNDPEHEAGEICVRGENVMMGYYKNEEATREILDEEGWLHTGDLGTMTPEGDIFIRGRIKSMILGPNGQNIYPEEIEAKLNNMPYVMESLVIEKNGKLYALVYPDFDKETSNSQEDMMVIMKENLKNLNKIVAPYEKVAEIRLYPTEFEKTPKKSIKRYLYSQVID